jgi:hypothetical protein
MLSGIADPLTQLPDMHAVIDIAEALIVEGLDAKGRDSFWFQLYRPEPNTTPVGFDEDEQLASFAAFENALERTER